MMLRVLKVIQIICHMSTCDLPDTYGFVLQAYISGKSLMSMLQLLYTSQFIMLDII